MSIDVEGTFDFNATSAEIWDAMLDTEVLAACLPAVQSIERRSENEFEIVFYKRFGVLPLKLPVLLDVTTGDAPKSWRLTARANHRVFGLASAGADIQTEALSATQTRLHYSAFASVGEAVLKLLGDAFQQRIEGWIDRYMHKFQVALDAKRRASVSV